MSSAEPKIPPLKPADLEVSTVIGFRNDLIDQYGNLIFDLGHCLLWSQAGATELTRKTFASLLKKSKKDDLGPYMRSWVLKTAINVARKLEPKIGRRLSAPERMMLDGIEKPADRLKQLESFFHRLDLESQALLLLRDKYHLELPEISLALGTPVASLKIQRKLAYSLLEDWIWGERPIGSSELFLWANHLSDILDSSVDPALVAPLAECKKKDPRCEVLLLQTSALRDQLNAMHTLKMPTSVESGLKGNEKFSQPKDLPKIRKFWERTPLYIRTSLEGLGIGASILLFVALVPRLRSLYEQSVERRLEAISLGDLVLPNGEEGSEENKPSAAPLARGKSPALPTEQNEQNADDFDGENDAEEALAQKVEKFKIGTSEIWRFNLKTDSPRDLRPKIVQILTDLRISEETKGFGGVEAPGGIQFDLYISTHVVSQLKTQLQRLVAPNQRSVLAHRPSHSAINNSSISDLFTWYRNKSRRRIPPGKARVVIWLSQT